MPHTVRNALLVMLLTAWLCPAAAARSPCTSPSPECVPVGEWDISIGLGAGQRSNPVRGAADIPLLLIPQISYYGKRFFIESLELGVTLYENQSNTFSLIAAPGYDRVFFYRHDTQNIFLNGALSLGPSQMDTPLAEFPLRGRHTTYLAGPEWTFSYGRFIGQLNALYEVTGEHDGYEVRTAVATPIIQSHGALVASVGATWKSARVVGYYYGVERLYEPGSAVNPFVKLGYSLPLSERWTFSAFAHYERLGSAVADSPIVSQSHVATVFAGFVFKVL
jgi:outer membrane protein